jgi:hypothetical protein
MTRWAISRAGEKITERAGLTFAFDEADAILVDYQDYH